MKPKAIQLFLPLIRLYSTYFTKTKQKTKRKKKEKKQKKESESKIFTIIVHDFTGVEFHICQSRVSLGRSRGQTCENENFRQWTFSS